MNIFSKLPNAKKGEVFQTILRNKNISIERITSQGQSTPKGKWLSGKTDEWVILLEGKSKLMFKDKSITLKKGDYVFIPANTNHRVEWTDKRQKSVWLAVHMKR